MSTLEVRLLGSPDVRRGGQPLPILRRQARALLYRLAVALQPVPREHLCFLFWPDCPDLVARRNLSHILTHLNSALSLDDLLLRQDSHLALNPDRVWSDTWQFERWCSTTGTGEGLRMLQHAVDLYRGPFLDGVSLSPSPEFESWMLLERRDWERQVQEKLSILVDRLTTLGDWAAAIIYARRYLAVDHLDEEMHRRLIQLYAITGDRAAAISQYQACASLLQRELGVAPLDETEALFRAVCANRVPSHVTTPGKPAWTTLPGPAVPLVGRDHALAQFHAAFERAEQGMGNALLISGESGIGKSRLLQHFASQMKERAVVLVGAGQPGAETLPYHPLIQALRSQSALLTYLASSFTLPHEGVAPIWLNEITRLLPELRMRTPDYALPAQGNADEARLRLFEALVQTVQALVRSGRCGLLCIDNLHWADQGTRDWLVYLAPRLPTLRLLVVGAYRTDQRLLVADLLQNLRRCGALKDCELAGLQFEDVLFLLRQVIGPRPGDEELAQRLQSSTGGNPFYLLQVLHTLQENGVSFEAGLTAEHLPLPDTVSEAIRARLGRLDPVTHQVVEACATLAPSFGFDLVRLTAGRREMEAVDSLDLLVRYHLLDEQEGVYRFHHDLVRRVVESELSATRRQLLHRRAGRALEQINRHAVTALAYHYDIGGDVGKATHYHELAAQRAEALFAWSEAAAHRSRILQLRPS